MMKVDISRTEAIVISHGHGDHTGGLKDALNACKSPDLFVHPAVFETKYFKGDSGSVPFTFPISRQELSQRVGKLTETRAPTLIRDGIMVTGQIPRLTDFEDTGVQKLAFLDSSLTISDPILDDQAVFFRVPEGIVILLGCGPSGIVNTMAYVSKITGEKQIYAVMGGTHLLGASALRIQKTVEALRQYGVQKIMLSHCTGVNAYAQLANAFPGRCSWPTSGTIVTFGGRSGG
jgi:7,8-dihydropterin-6-yl-methyl-4-(beta-D-ribofuranosyl)aminobenzene 5'-phosphate synthase